MQGMCGLCGRSAWKRKKWCGNRVDVVDAEARRSVLLVGHYLDCDRDGKRLRGLVGTRRPKRFFFLRR